MFFSKKLLKNPNITHCFFSNRNGVSKNIYKSLNCGLGSKDKKLNIIKNLHIVSKKIGTKYKNLIIMKQTHSNKILFFGKNKKIKNKIICDGILTNKKRIALAVLTADCIPILIYDEKKNIIGAIHAGWRGAFKDIILKTLNKLSSLGINKKNLIVSIGPCIAQKNYEVGIDFYKKFWHKNVKNKFFFKKLKNKKYLFNLRKYVQYQFQKQGIKNIDHIKRNTFAEKNNFYSYRRSLLKSETDYGRNISVIMIN